MDSNTVKNRLAMLRREMSSIGLDAYIVTDSDTAGSEYPADHFRTRTWLTGFDGSNGTCVVTSDNVYMWTDGRYRIQSEKQLAGTDINPVIYGTENALSIGDFLITNSHNVGICGETYMASDYDSLYGLLAAHGICLSAVSDLTESLWDDERASIPNNPIFTLGESHIDLIRAEIKKRDADMILICGLDAVAWAFGFRGSDISDTPVAYARGIITLSEAILFIHRDKAPASVLSRLALDNVKLLDYEKTGECLRSISAGMRIIYDPQTVSVNMRTCISDEAVKIEAPEPINLLKAVKTDAEINDIRRSHERDGIAMVRFLMWLEDNAGKTDEFSAAEALREFRARDKAYLGDSFSTICAFRENGAIVHYQPKKESAAAVGGGGFLVLDSGGQYLDGTTDITRTVWVGEPADASPAEKHDYTLVLKAHIALAAADFRYGVAGAHLDALPRRLMWAENLDYAHGTGHGVGYVLGVHETPPTITSSPDADYGARIPIEPNMVFSNEPGLYRAEQYGIRIENLVTPYISSENEFGKFLKLETLSLCPIDIRVIDAEVLTTAEKDWIDHYHSTVYTRLASELTEVERTWLAAKTRPI